MKYRGVCLQFFPIYLHIRDREGEENVIVRQPVAQVGPVRDLLQHLQDGKRTAFNYTSPTIAVGETKKGMKVLRLKKRGEKGESDSVFDNVLGITTDTCLQHEDLLFTFTEKQSQ